MNYQIKIFNSHQQNSGFYSIMGEHFASLEHKKELDGWQVYNKDGSTWFLITQNKLLIGFCALFKTNNYLYLDNFIILKSFRNMGFSKILLEECIKYSEDKIKAITKNICMIKVFEEYNFRNVGNRGSYLIYERS